MTAVGDGNKHNQWRIYELGVSTLSAPSRTWNLLTLVRSQEPDGRGTFGILKSCVITLVLCVYTALHLNIPPANSSKASLIWRKTKWILVGLFAPEVVVYAAWAQRQRVKTLSKDVASIFAEEVSSDPTENIHLID